MFFSFFIALPFSSLVFSMFTWVYWFQLLCLNFFFFPWKHTFIVALHAWLYTADSSISTSLKTLHPYYYCLFFFVLALLLSSGPSLQLLCVTFSTCMSYCFSSYMLWSNDLLTFQPFEGQIVENGSKKLAVEEEKFWQDSNCTRYQRCSFGKFRRH